VRLIALLLALPLAAIAQTAEQRLNMNELVREALLRNPEVLAAQKKYEAARQRPAQERSLPDPMLSLGWNSTGNPLPLAGVGTDPVANAGFMASQEIPAPGKLRLRGEIASKEAEAEAQEFRAVSLDVAARVKQAYFGLEHAYAIRELLERNREQLRMLLHVTEARYSVAKAAQADVFKAQTQITIMETRLLQIDRDRRVREAEINSLLNRPANAPVGQPAGFHIEPLTFTVDDLIDKARVSAPALARDQKRVERAGTAVNLAQKDYYPDITLNGGYYYMGSMRPMYSFRADVKIPIRLGRTRAEVTERSQEMAQAKHTYEATAQSLEYRIREEYLDAQTAQKLVDLYSKVVMPQARLAVDSSLAGYQTGGTDFLSVLTNELAAIEYEMNYHEQRHEVHMSLVRLEQMTGVELIP
jgi:cobalt-zinc-cadmium efflux system outer membrane protein